MILKTEYVVINDRGVVHVRVCGSHKTLCGVGTWDELRKVEKDIYEPIWALDNGCQRCGPLLKSRTLLCEPMAVHHSSAEDGESDG